MVAMLCACRPAVSHLHIWHFWADSAVTSWPVPAEITIAGGSLNRTGHRSSPTPLAVSYIKSLLVQESCTYPTHIPELLVLHICVTCSPLTPLATAMQARVGRISTFRRRRLASSVPSLATSHS